MGARPKPMKVRDAYSFGDVIGAGGFAEVKLATNKSTGKQCAMKCMTLPKGAKAQRQRDDVFYEVGLLARLDSEYVIRMYEFFVEGGEVFLATELLAGGDLLDAVIDAGRYDESMARKIFRRVLMGVQYLHDVGITHRDMKLENLLLGRERGTPFVCSISVSLTLPRDCSLCSTRLPSFGNAREGSRG